LFLNISYAGQTIELKGNVLKKTNFPTGPNGNTIVVRDINIDLDSDDPDNDPICTIGGGYYGELGGKNIRVTENVVRVPGSSISSRKGCVLHVFGGYGSLVGTNKVIIYDNSHIDISPETVGSVYGVFVSGSMLIWNGVSNASVEKNEVSISGTEISSPAEIRIVGGAIQNSSDVGGGGKANVKNNKVSILPGVKLDGHSVSICGVYILNGSVEPIDINSTKNEVDIFNIDEGVDLEAVCIYGYYSESGGGGGINVTSNGNKLNMFTDSILKVYNIKNFENVKIVIVGDPENARIELECCQDLNRILEVGLSIDTKLKPGDSIELMHISQGFGPGEEFIEQQATGKFEDSVFERTSRFDFKFDTDTITAILLEDKITSRPETRSYPVSRAVSVYSLARAYDFDLSDIVYAGERIDDVVRGFHVFGTILGGRTKYKNIEEGLDSKGIGGLVGIKNKFEMFRDTTIWGVVFDFGSRSYGVKSTDDLSTWKVYAKGNASNLGIRAFGEITLGEEHEKLSGMYIDGSIGIGNQRTDYKTDDIKSTMLIIREDQIIKNPSQFDFSVTYWGAHIGCGAKYPYLVAGKKLDLKIFGRYRLIHLGGGEVVLLDNRVLTFSGTWSNCISLGSKWIYELKPNTDVFLCISLKQEIGKVKSESAGFPIKDLSLTGATLGVELGTKINIKERLMIDLVLQCSMISEIGCNVMLNLVYPLGKVFSKETNYSKEIYPEVS
jgi:hypothetical protein